MRYALVITLLLRVLYSAGGSFLAPHLNLRPEIYNSNNLIGLMPQSDSLAYRLIGVWQRFDAIWYAGIAERGYDAPAAWVFYPLYPLLTGTATRLGGDAWVWGLILSTVAAFFAFWGLHQLVLLDGDLTVARRAVVLLAVWPGSFILFAGYPDGLVLAFAVWSVYMARRDAWLAAGALGAAAGLSKAAGAAVIVALAVLAWRKREARPWLALTIAAAGALAFPVYQRMNSVDPAAIYEVHWKTTTAAPWTTLAASVQSILSGDAIALWNLGIFIVVMAVALGRRVRPEYRALTASLGVLLLLKNTYEPLQSMSRYVLLVFPFFAASAARFSSLNAFAVTATALFLWNLLFARTFFEWLLIV